MAVFICRKNYHFKSENKTKGDKNFNLSMMKTKENTNMKKNTAIERTEWIISESNTDVDGIIMHRF